MSIYFLIRLKYMTYYPLYYSREEEIHVERVEMVKIYINNNQNHSLESMFRLEGAASL